MISLYAQTKNCKKGTILEASANERETIKILISGKFGVFQPIGSNSYINCCEKAKRNILKTNQLNMLIDEIHENR